MCDDCPDIHGATESNDTTKSSASMLLEVKKHLKAMNASESSLKDY